MFGNLSYFAVVYLCAAFLLTLTGCSRKYYRQKADGEAYSLLACASKDPRWELNDYRINIDPRSRMYDRFDPDCEPMPPDDPASHRKMHCVDGKKGAKHWEQCGCAKCVENSSWRDYLLYNQDGAILLDQNGVVELALLNSPEYQSALENLYLSALKVSKERFRFDVQFYGGDSLFYSANGRLRGEGYGTFLKNDAYVRAEKLFATGGELAVGLANSITWSFCGPDTWSANSILNISLLQPLLRSAGRKVVLESLTQSERDFLAATRQTVYFQQGFYTQTITGQGTTGGPELYLNDMQRVSAQNIPTLQSGFYGLLAEQIRIQNQRQNIVRLEDNLERFKEVFAAGQMTDIYQVEETRQNLLNSESTLLQRIGAYQENIETYLRSLGLPPDLKVEVDDPLMQPFQLTSSKLIDIQTDLNGLLGVVRKKDQAVPDDFVQELKRIVKGTEGEIKTLYNDLGVLEKSIPKRLENLKKLETQLAGQIQSGDRYDPSIYSTKIFVDRVARLRNIEIPKNVRRLNAAFTLVDSLAQSDELGLRQVLLAEQYDDETLDALYVLGLLPASYKLEEQLIGNLHDIEASKPILRDLRNEFRQAAPLRTKNRKELEQIETALSTQSSTEAQKIIAELKTKDPYRDWIRKILSALQNEIVTLSIMQTRARLDSIVLVPTTIKPEEAFCIASQNRLDWMNRKAQLVDSWRQIDIAANRLRGDLNVKVEGELGTIDKRGVRFDGDAGRLSVGLEWDSPLTRHNEMINYRQAQIQYQAARRNYYTYVDSVNAELRNLLRDIQINMVEFEIKRNAILTATIRVDVMQLKMDQPPQRGAKIDVNTADQLIRALDSLMSSQNNFLNIWVSYQTQRMLLDLKLGTMQLDSCGRWIDPGTISGERVGPPVMFGTSNPYGGALASDSGLRPSNKRSKRQTVRQSQPIQGPTLTGRLLEDYDVELGQPIPPAPRLDSNNLSILNENALPLENSTTPILAPPNASD